MGQHNLHLSREKCRNLAVDTGIMLIYSFRNNVVSKPLSFVSASDNVHSRHGESSTCWFKLENLGDRSKIKSSNARDVESH